MSEEMQKLEQSRQLRWQLQEQLDQIKLPDEGIYRSIMQEWDRKAKPLGGLGRLEELTAQVGAIFGTKHPTKAKKAVVVMAADNGVVAEGVTQTDSSVTATVTCNMTKENAAVTILAAHNGAEVFPIDIGIGADLGSFASEELSSATVWNRKLAWGTGNIAREPAMTQQETILAVLTGIDAIRRLRAQEYLYFAAGEMGIGNTTTSSAVTAVLLGLPAEEVTGRGAGLSAEGLRRKREAVRQALLMNQPDADDVIDTLSKVGGLDLAGLTGCYLGAAIMRVPIILDGFISAVAALAAVRLCPACRPYMIPSHCSAEPAARMVLQALDMEPYIQAGMHLGEGTGAVLLFPLLDSTLDVYEMLPGFADINVKAYEHYEEEQL